MMDKYQPPKVWQNEASKEGQFSSINRPTSGARFDQELPRGKHPFQLYSLGTPNGVKITIMLEELLSAGHAAEYNAHIINIMEGHQFSSGFVGVNPNSKIPALIDTSTKEDTRVFESGAILLYLAEKFDAFLPTKNKAEVLSWLFWQVGSGPYVGGGFGHFYNYAPEKIKYAIDRFSMETKRQLDVLDQRLSKNEYIAGSEYSIADMAIWPWYGALVKGTLYNAAEFLDTKSYKHVTRWTNQILERKAVLRGRLVNRPWGDEDQQIKERHDASDFDGIDISFR